MVDSFESFELNTRRASVSLASSHSRSNSSSPGVQVSSWRTLPGPYRSANCSLVQTHHLYNVYPCRPFLLLRISRAFHAKGVPRQYPSNRNIKKNRNIVHAVIISTQDHAIVTTRN